MSKIEEALVALRQREDLNDRALHLAGLISSLFKMRGVLLALTGDLVYSVYTNTELAVPEVELAVMGNGLPLRTRQEVIVGQLEGQGSAHRWEIAEIQVRFVGNFSTPNFNLCRDFQTDYGIVKMTPAEDLAADLLLSAYHPIFQEQAYNEAFYLIKAGLAAQFIMDWPVLQELCATQEYKMSEQLSQIRADAMRALDAEESGAQVAEQEVNS